MPFAIVALVVALLAGGGAVYASQDAVPGNALYGVKAITEQAELAIPSSAETKADRYLTLATNRLNEIEKVHDVSIVRALGKRYAAEVGSASELIAQAEAEGRDTALLVARFGKILSDHTDRLERLESRAPEAALPGLDQALDAALGGLERPIAFGKANRGALPGKGITRTAELSETKTLTDSTWYSNTLSTIKTVTGTVGISLTNAFSDVVALSNDQQVPGESFKGLAAKLRAAAEAIGRGQPAVAKHQLDAFLNHLDAMRRSSHISEAAYTRLAGAYQQLAAALGASAANAGTGKGQSDEALHDQGGKDTSEQNDTGDNSSEHGPKSKPTQGSSSFPPGRGRR